MTHEMKDILLLLTGAAGALVAIFLKEAVQQAMQRRTLTWQLAGYLMAFKSLLTREESTARLYAQILEREKQLFVSYSSGTEAFQARQTEHAKELGALRATIRAGAMQFIEQHLTTELNAESAELLDRFAENMSQRRAQLLDSKTFLSDKDAAVLGRAVAINVIQYRSAMSDLLTTFEALTMVVRKPGPVRAAVTTALVDQIVMHGQALLVAFARLERYTAHMSKQSILGLLWSVVRGR